MQALINKKLATGEIMQKVAVLAKRIDGMNLSYVAYHSAISVGTLRRIRSGKSIKTSTAEKLYDYLESRYEDGNNTTTE